MSHAGDPQLHVVDSGGEGRPVVLIHGWPLSGQSWRHQLEPLRASGHRVVTYDRRGFGRSQPGDRYDYDTLADDLARVLTDLDLRDAVLVGFSMGGGEVARYVARHGEERLRGVVFAAAVPPYLLQVEGNPDGPLATDAAHDQRVALETDRDAFFEKFTTTFFSGADGIMVSEEERQEAIVLAQQSDQTAALECMDAFSSTDFRGDLEAITVPTLVIHGDADQIVPLDGSGRRTANQVANSQLHVVAGGPHGLNVSHAEEFNRVLADFLAVR